MEEDKLKQVSDNARIRLTEDEVDTFSSDLDSVLEKFESLQEVDLGDVEPAFHPVELEEETRADEEGPSLTQERALSNSENTERGYFKGPSA
jgi:aspartyl-tRNA(Asn)/glutamyl-tRNA(Gln) amidotransferase subunit C